ncbi:MAG: hypothetical protein Q8R33_05360 [Burkholderiales bacterium]|nr:hypothetical protein [Burkholderiales bacterium]
MTTLTRTARLISAATAVATTFVLFNAVLSNAEPQRSVLIAKTQRLETLPAAPFAVAMASNAKAKVNK